MAKLHYYYSTMNAGKSTHLLQANHNYKSDGHETMLLKPDIDDRMGVSIIGSRIGISAEAIPVSTKDDIFEMVKEQHAKTPLTAVFVDESQFFNRKQIRALAKVADILNISVLAYGLKNNFKGEVFEGSKVLLELADNLREIKTTCHCGSKATMVLKYDQQGTVMRGGAEVDIGAEEKYVATCRKHFMEGDIGNTARRGLKQTDILLVDELATIISKTLKISFESAREIVKKDGEDNFHLGAAIVNDIEHEIDILKAHHSNNRSMLSQRLLEKSLSDLELLRSKMLELSD